MSSTGIRKQNSIQSRSRKSLIDNEINFIQSLKVFDSFSSIGTLGGAGGTTVNSGTPAGNFLLTAGGVMIGAISYNPVAVQISATGHIDITRDDTISNFSTYVLMTGLGSPDTLNFIDGAQNNGQSLKLQGTATQIITIKHASIGTISNIVGLGTVTVTTTVNHNMTTGDLVNILDTNNFNVEQVSITVTSTNTFTYSATGSATPETSGTYQNGNVVTSDGLDITLDGTAAQNTVPWISLIFDGTVLGFGAWRAESGQGSGGGGVSLPIDFPITFLGTIAGPIQDIDFSLFTRHGWKAELSANITLTFSNPPTGNLGLATFKFKQDVTGNRTLTLPVGTVNKDIVEAGFLLGSEEETGIVIEFFNDTFYAFLETGNQVSGGGDVSQWSSFDAIQTVNMATNGLTNLTISNYVDTGSVVRGSISGDSGTASLRLATATGGKFLISDVITDIAQFDDTTGLTMLGSHVINLNKQIMNTIGSLQFDNSTTFTPIAVNTIGFDDSLNAIKYNVALTSDLHLFQAGGELLAGISRVGSNSGLLTIDNIIANELVQIDEQLFFTDSSTDPTINGQMRRNGTTIKAMVNGVVKDFADIGSGGGADVNLSNILNTSIPTDLLPSIAGTFNLGSAALRWGNCFFGRIVFPTNTSPIAGDVNIVRNNNDMQSNVGTGNTFNWTFQAGSTQMELSSTELRLPGVNLDLENNNITDVNQLQLTGISGDTVFGLLTADSSGITLNAQVSGDTIDFGAHNGTSVVNLLRLDPGAGSGNLIFDATNMNALTLNGSIIATAGSISFDVVAGTQPTILPVSNDMQFGVGAGDSWLFDDGQLVAELSGINGFQIYTPASQLAGAFLGVDAATDILELKVGNNVDFSITDNGSIFFQYVTSTTAMRFVGNAGIQLDTDFIDINDISSNPATPPTGFGRFFLFESGGVQTLRFKFDNGVVKDIVNDV